MSRIHSAILSAAVVLFLIMSGFGYAAQPDDLISRLMTAPKNQWLSILASSKQYIDQVFMQQVAEKAQAAYNRKDYASSLRYMEIGDYADYTAREKAEFKALYLSFMGRIFFKDGLDDWVFKTADSISEFKPGHARAHLLRGKVYAGRKEADKAIAELRPAVEKEPDSEDGHLTLAYAYLLKSQNELSLKHFREAARINPENSYAKDAIATLTGTVKQAKYTDNAEALKHFNEAEKYFTTAKYNEAIVSYKKAIAADPNFTKAWVYMGDAYIGIGDTETAISCYKKAISIDPNDRQAHRFLGSTLEKRYDATGNVSLLDQAIESYENAVRVAPDYATAASDLKRAKEKRARVK